MAHEAPAMTFQHHIIFLLNRQPSLIVRPKHIFATSGGYRDLPDHLSHVFPFLYMAVSLLRSPTLILMRPVGLDSSITAGKVVGMCRVLLLCEAVPPSAHLGCGPHLTAAVWLFSSPSSPLTSQLLAGRVSFLSNVWHIVGVLNIVALIIQFLIWRTGTL